MITREFDFAVIMSILYTTCCVPIKKGVALKVFPKLMHKPNSKNSDVVPVAVPLCSFCEFGIVGTEGILMADGNPFFILQIRHLGTPTAPSEQEGVSSPRSETTASTRSP